MDHAAVMTSCGQKARRLGIASLSEVERAIALANWADFEIANGGLWQFYYNSGGNNAAETVDALRVIGTDRAADGLKAANALFPGGSPPRDREQRFRSLQRLSESPGNPLDQLTCEFYRQTPDIFTRLEAYLDAHADELREHEPRDP